MIIDGMFEIILIMKVIILLNILKWFIIILIIKLIIIWINVVINDKVREYLRLYYNLVYKFLFIEFVLKMWLFVKNVLNLFLIDNFNGLCLVIKGIIRVSNINIIRVIKLNMLVNEWLKW